MKQKIADISAVVVEYNTALCNLAIDLSEIDNPRAYPCSASIHQVCQNPGADLDTNTMPLETIRAKYVIGADGGRSVTRQLMGFDMIGTKGTSLWGVMDFSGGSDFPE
jgi:phenol 2-monooxygenase